MAALDGEQFSDLRSEPMWAGSKPRGAHHFSADEATMANGPKDFMQRFRVGIWALAGSVLVILLAVAIS